jgi:hypothetical protein
MTAYQAQRRIETKLSLAKAFLPFIVCAGFRFAEDHSGDDALFFSVVLSDQAAKEKRLLANTKQFQEFLRSHLDLEEINLFWYFNYRTESEMRQMAAKYPPENQNVRGWGWEDVRQTEPAIAGGQL